MHVIPVPVLDAKDPFVTLRRWDTWHAQVTVPVYKNACGTHSAIATLLEGEANRSVIAGGSDALKRFERIVLSDLLVGYPAKHTRDEELWACFQNRFRTCLDVTNEKEEKYLYEALFRRSRQPGESVYSLRWSISCPR
jgi:hypothetical protein